MNIDFALPATGANARRLLHIANVFGLNLDKKISEIAKEDLIPDQDEFLPLTGVRKAATQFIIDCDFRCAILRLSVEIDRYLIVNALALSKKYSKITVVSNTPVYWKTCFKGFSDFDVKYYSTEDIFKPEYQNGRRDGVLLMDFTYHNPSYITSLAREFPKTIIYWESANNIENIENTPWLDMGHALYPNFPGNDRHRYGNFYKSKKADSSAAIFYSVFLPSFANIPGYMA